jgi:hypothetical protein|tara:strand:+ start:3061 stop:3951 length:891 start_codon:yes stop_codon:yes gene_type:complete
MSKSYPLASLYSQTGGKRLSFPNNIEETKHFAMFFLSEDVRYDAKSIEEKDAQGTIILPLPGGLSTGYKADYGTEDLGVLGMAAADIASGAMSGDGFINSITNKIKSLSLDDVQGAAMNVGLGLLASELGSIATGGASKGALYGAGVARNPHQAVLFNNVGFRSHSFSYEFVPKNFQEQNSLNDIIFMFKTAMLPDYIKGNHFFKYPAKFDINLTDDSKYLFDIKNSVLTSFDVDYHGQGGDFYHDINGVKAPVGVKLSMSFLETSIMAREDAIDESGREVRSDSQMKADNVGGYT